MVLPQLPAWATKLGLLWVARPERKELWLHKALLWLDDDGFHSNVEDWGQEAEHHYGHIDRIDAINKFLGECESLFLYDAIQDGCI